MPCTSTIIYILLSTIAIFIQYSINQKINMAIGVSVIFSCIWVYLLSVLCYHNMQGLAWLLVVLPFIVGFFIMETLLSYAIREPSILSKYGTPVPQTK